MLAGKTTGQDNKKAGTSGQILPEHLGAAGTPQLRERLGLDLADALPCHAELPVDLLERARMSDGETEPELDDALLPDRQVVQDTLQLILENDEGRRLHRHDRVRVLDEVAQIGILFADR